MSCLANAMSMKLWQTILKFRANYCFLLGYASDLKHWTILKHTICHDARPQTNNFKSLAFFASFVDSCCFGRLHFIRQTLLTITIYHYYLLSQCLCLSLSFSRSLFVSFSVTLTLLLPPFLSLLVLTGRVSESFSRFVCIIVFTVRPADTLAADDRNAQWMRDLCNCHEWTGFS